ncbi:MAG: acetylxylan esterase [Kiritimatiellae bacterium]|nr:acetylxylan esterase [Kiritimatiellia bacterium]
MKTLDEILGFLHCRLQCKRIVVLNGGCGKCSSAIVKRLAPAAAFLFFTAYGATYKVDIDRPSGVYRCGEKATFTVRLLSTDNLASNDVPCAMLDNFGTSVLTNLPFRLDSTGVAFTVAGTLEKPGFLRLSLPPTRNGRNDPFVFSVGFEPEKIVKGSPSPEDFDAFWTEAKERLDREVPLDPQIVRVPELCTADFDYYRISFATFGRRVHGYMSIPADRSKAPFPVDFGVNAAGFGDWTNDMAGDKDSIRVQFSVYPFPPDWKWRKSGIESKYKMMNAELQAKYGASSYNHAGIASSREEYFFYPVILGINRAVDWLAARADVDRSRFWYQGTSQGGGFGFYLCGLNRAFTRAAFYVPAITDTMGYLKGRASGWPKIVENNSSSRSRRIATEKWAPYFDGANFASRITCPMRIAVGFSDTTCPPCAVYAAYNEIKVADKGIVNGIGMTHSCSRRFYEELGGWVKQSSRHPVSAAQVADDTWAKYVPEFNRLDDELYANAISNSAAEAFLRENAPSFSCPDEDIERIYHFRWWTYRKHLRRSSSGGWVVTEFLPDVSWAGVDNTISCPLGHQIREGRWLRNGEFIRDYMNFMISKGTVNGPRSYTCWPAASLIDFAKVTGDFSICGSLLGRLVENYEAWEKGWISSKGFKVGLHPEQRLFHQRADREGTEYALSPDGARPMVNSSMWAEANAIANIARRKGENAIAERFEKKAQALADAVRKKLWNEEKRFFIAADTNGVLSSVCELHGYAPFYFGMPMEAKYKSAWRLLTNESGFLAPKGLVFPARNTPGFTVEPDYAGHECLWNGPSWPYATSIALSALCGELQSDSAAALPLNASGFVRLLKQYAAQHYLLREDGVKVPWIDENLHPFTGEWLARHIMIEQDRRGIKKMRYVERGKDYNHSTFCDLVISGLCGLVPREDGRIEVRPLAPESWDWWRLNGVRYHGHNLTILFDRDGSRYGKGKGLVVLKDGQKFENFKR